MMPRYQRKQSPTRTYHIMLRGNEKKDIFLDNNDRIKFLETLRRMKEDESYYLYAYCLMTNHVHLLLAENNDSLSRVMKRVGVSYAYYFNHKYERVGHLFQDRFKSEIIDTDAYLRSASRYIHNNPVKAKIVKSAGEYKWSSYNSYINNYSSSDDLIDKELLLGVFSDDRDNAVKHLIEFTSQSAEDSFIDYDTPSNVNSGMLTDLEIKEIIGAILEEHRQDVCGIKDCADKAVRKMMLQKMKARTGASVRQLSRITGISKDIIFRA